MKKDSQGFTIIELMVSTMVFGVLIVITSAAVVQIGRQFYKGIIAAKTLESSRAISDEVTRNIQFSASPPSVRTNGHIIAVCVSEKEYMFARGRQLQTPPITASDGAERVAMRFDACNTAAPLPATIPATWGTPLAVSGTELLAENMRIAKLNLTATGPKTWNLSLRVVYGDRDLLEDVFDDDDLPTLVNNPDSCRNGVVGSQFCASSELNVSVFKQL
jgi:prepilin-type N-terminal cleavage/methylation domain-containing protein